METITFYSYKGGVGRTLALANIAIYLSRFGQNVCVLDFDLEAPGLHYKLSPLFPGPVQSGLVDYIYGFIEGGTIPGSIEKYCLKAEKVPAGYGHIGLIPAGNVLSAQYWKRLAAIDWHDLFYREDSEGIPFFLDFKEKIREQVKPDYLLIDSRTGITEMGGLCTSLLTDRVVFFIGNNRENIEGARQILRGIQASPRLPDQEPVKINFVLTRIPLPAEGKGAGREEEIVKDIKKFLNEGAENLGDQLNITDITVLHSDRDLELAEGLRLTEENLIEMPLARDYLKLFSKIIPAEVLKPKIQELLDKLVTPRRAMEEPEKIKSELEAIVYAYPQSGLIDKLTDLFYYRMKDRPAQDDDVAILEQYRKGLQDYEKRGYSRGIAESLIKIGSIYQERGDYDAALEHYQKSLEIAEKEKYLPEKSVSLFQLGVIYQFKCQYDNALSYYKKSLEIRERIGDNAGISKCLHQVGMIYQMKGDYNVATDYYQKSLEIKERIGDIAGIAKSLHEIGNIYFQKGDYDVALDKYHKSLEINEKIGDIAGISKCLHQIGNIHFKKGDYDAAMEQYKKSLEIKENIGDIKGISTSLHQIGLLYQEKGEYDAALTQYQKSLKIENKIGDIQGVAITLHQVGRVYHYKEEFDAALDHYRKALEIFKDIGDIKNEANALHQVGMIYEEKGDFDVALSHYQQSMKIREKIGDVPGRSESYGQLGQFYFKKNNLKTALRYFLQALDICKRIGSPNVTLAKIDIARIREKLGEKEFQALLDRTRKELDLENLSID